MCNFQHNRIIEQYRYCMWRRRLILQLPLHRRRQLQHRHFRDDFGWKPSPPQLQDVNRAKAFLDIAARALEESKALEQMEQLKKTQKQVYLDLIGDSCHAAHGLETWP